MTWRFAQAWILMSLIASGTASAFTLDIAQEEFSPDAPGRALLQFSVLGLGDGTAPSLGGFDFTIEFNPELASFRSVTFGDPVFGNQLDLGNGSSTFAAVIEPGKLRFSEQSLASPDVLAGHQRGDFTFATVLFDRAAGFPTLEFIHNNGLRNEFGDLFRSSEPLGPGDLELSQFRFVPVGTIQPVPEPTGTAMLGLGALLIGLAYRWKRDRNA